MPVLTSMKRTSAEIDLDHHFGSLTSFVHRRINRTEFFKFQTGIIFSNNTRIWPQCWSVPPAWNVRNVNCVPGSPIDWAAHYKLTFLNHMVRSETTVALRTNTLLRSQVNTNELNAFNRRFLNLGDIFCNFFTTGNRYFTVRG